MMELLKAEKKNKDSAFADLESRLNKLAGEWKIKRQDLFGILYVLVVFKERNGKEISFSKIVTDPDSLKATKGDFQLHEIFAHAIKRWGEGAFQKVYSILGEVKGSVFKEEFPVLYDGLLYEYAENLSKYRGLISTPKELSRLLVK